jgi:hypothetical protein
MVWYGNELSKLKEQIKTLEGKIEDVKAEAIAKQAMVIIQKSNKSVTGKYIHCNTCGYNSYSEVCPNCGAYNYDKNVEKEYKNLDTVIDSIRKEEAVKLGIDLVEMDKKLNELTIEKMKLQNQLTLKVAELEESLKFEKKEKDAAINLAKERIRKQMNESIERLNAEVEELEDELILEDEELDLQLEDEELLLLDELLLIELLEEEL